MQNYLDLVALALESPLRPDRTGTGTHNLFGATLRYDLSQGFPATTTKTLAFKTMIAELCWLLNGETNIRGLLKHKAHIWDAWADAQGDLGPVYGAQWRAWPTAEGPVDQIQNVLTAIKTDPDSRRLVVSAWNVSDLPRMALAPCHVMYQFFVDAGRLSCAVYQRSADLFLGLPFNLASYATLTHLVAKSTGLLPGELVHNIGVAHVYHNHVDQARLMLSRTPLSLPTLEIDGVGVGHDLRGLDPSQFRLRDYQGHGVIKAPIAV